MTFVTVLAQVMAVVALLILLTAPPIVGRNRLVQLRRHWRRRLRAAAPSLLILAAILLINRTARQLVPELSWIVGFRITGLIYGIEGTLVAWLQSFATPLLTTYFTYVYVYGYVYLLVFPLVAYLALEDPRPIRETALAYTFNYGIGLVCYVLFVAYGPRNMMPDLVSSLLISSWPQAALLITEINVNTNVFPSLHTSLSVTVALLAYRTRRIYPLWTVIAIPLAASIVGATMYIGSHWAIDVLAGTGLAVISVALAKRIQLPDNYEELRARFGSVGAYLRGAREQVRRRIRS